MPRSHKAQPLPGIEALRAHVAELERQAAERGRAEEAARALAEVGRELAETLDFEEATSRVVSAVLRLFRGRRSSLFRLERASGALVCVAAAGETDPAKWIGQRLAAREGIVGLAAAEERPMWSSDVFADPRVVLPRWIHDRAREERYAAVVAVPLRARGEVMGVLSLGDTAGRVFTEEELGLLGAFADQAALALLNARFYRRAEERAQKFSALARLSRLINSADSRRVFQAVAEAATTLLGAKMARVWVDDPRERVLRVQGSFGIDPAFEQDVTEYAELRYGLGMVGKIFESQAPEYVLEVQGDSRWVNQRFAREADLHAFAGVPLLAGGRCLGILAVLFGRRPLFIPEERELIELLADHAAIAIRNARLLEESRQRGREAESLAEVGRLLSQSLDPAEVGQRVADSVRSLLRAHTSTLFRLEPESEALVSVAISGDPGPMLERNMVFPKGTGVAGLAVQARRPVMTPDVLTDLRVTLSPENRSRIEQAPFRAILAVPLIAMDRVIGALGVGDEAGRVFTEDEIRLAEAFADQAASALENARLYREVREALEELKQTQEQLTQSQKMEAVGRLAGGIAHDFNNLLTVITGRAELLLSRLRPEDRLRRDVELIQKTAQRAAGLVRQILAFSRKQVLQPEVLDLGVLVGNMGAILRRLIGEDIELVTQAAPDLGRVKADPGQLEQVILNLAVNARDAMPDGGRLTIEMVNVSLEQTYADRHVAVEPGSYVMLAVSDTGCGMDAETQSRIFEPFFTTKELGKGTGLGLSTVYGIVKQSGGNIWVYSEPGRGTAFKIYLPRVDETATSPESGAAPAATLRGSATILLVEDEAELREIAREVLEASGYTVLEGRHGGEAILVSERHAGRIDLLVTDVVMPQMGGRALVERLAPLRPEMKVLYMSGYADQAIVHHGVLEPGTALLQKPFTPDDLLRKVRDILNAPRPA